VVFARQQHRAEQLVVSVKDVHAEVNAATS
jgi:hypothetical protein